MKWRKFKNAICINSIICSTIQKYLCKVYYLPSDLDTGDTAIQK